jgi:hypothetical protein
VYILRRKTLHESAGRGPPYQRDAIGWKAGIEVISAHGRMEAQKFGIR